MARSFEKIVKLVEKGKQKKLTLTEIGVGIKYSTEMRMDYRRLDEDERYLRIRNSLENELEKREHKYEPA